MPDVPVQVSSLRAALKLTETRSIVMTMLGPERQIDSDRKIKA